MKKKIPWRLCIPPEVYTEYTGTKLGLFHTDGKVMLETQLEAGKIFHEKYGLPAKDSVGCNMTSYISASVLGAEVIFPEDDAPQLRGRVVNDLADIYTLQSPVDIATAGLFPDILKRYEYMQDALKDGPVRAELDIGVQGPFTTAVLLRGSRIFEEMYTESDEVKRLIEIATETTINIIQFRDEYTGVRTESVCMTDDYGGLISPEMYQEFCLPHMIAVFEALAIEKSKRTLHCETLKRGHLKYLDEAGISWFDPGVNESISVNDILSETAVTFAYNIFTVRDMKEGTPESIRALYLRAVADGAPEMMTEICRETPPENIEAFLNVAREYE